MPTRPEATRPDVGLGIGLRLSVLSLDESSHSWTDDLPVCHLSGLGSSTNQIYREDGIRREEHQFEDRSFRFKLNDETFFYGLFDGHEGVRAADFASQRMPAEVLLDQLEGKDKDEEIRDVLLQAFHTVEKGFFESIDDLLAEKANLQLQLQCYSSYEAYQKFPEVVNRLREVMAEVSSGTTAVVALIVNDKLYVANAGDSRALLCKVINGSREVCQLSVDHDISNEDELLRLSQLGLDVDKIRSGNLLGNQENTRCLGNYIVKGGYKDFDILSLAKEEPVISEPEIYGGIPIDDTCNFLILMSDGLYKSLEEATGTRQVNLDIADLVLEQFCVQSNLTAVAQAVVDRIVRFHHDMYMTPSQGSKMCQKRDDITLLIRNFNQPLPNSMQSPNSSSIHSSNSPINVNQHYAPASGLVWPSMMLKTGGIITAAPGSDISSQNSIFQARVDKTVTESSSSESQQLFHTNRSATLTLDDESRIKPYVDFGDYYNAVEEGRQKGELPEGLDF